MSTEIVQIVIEHDGQLSQLIIPNDRKGLALKLLSSVFDDGVLVARKLPPEFYKVPLSEAIAGEAKS